MAVTLLSVNIPGSAAHRLLVRDRARYNALLAEVGRDRDLVEVDEPITDDWPASVLYRAVRELPKVGRTKRASCSPASARHSSRSGTASSVVSPRPATTSGSRYGRSCGSTTPPCTAGSCGCATKPASAPR